MSRSNIMKDAYIVTAIRTPGCRSTKGAFKDTRPDDLLAFILKAALEKTSNLNSADVADVMVGCSFPEAEQGLNIGRIASLMAGLPESVSGATINRFCASGLEAISLAALRIMAGWSEVTLAGGIESMTYVPMGGNMLRPNPEYAHKKGEFYVSMGITAENVAKRYKVLREDQDAFAYQSHMKAAKAQQEGYFTEIVATPAAKFTLTKKGTYQKETFMQAKDDGVRPTTSLEKLAQLPPVFALNGSVTAGNASQTTDGAAAVVIMSAGMVKKTGVTPIARLKLYTTVGCKPDEMGVGPAVAIPKLLDMAGLSVRDIGCWEINEAFASQALYCLRKIGIEDQMDRVNVNGGAIALGHPLGCTGAKLCATLLANMRRLGAKYGVESMCIGGGMGAAALFELCD